MPDSLPVSNVEFDPHRYSSDRPKSNSTDKKKKKQKPDQPSKNEKEDDKRQSSNEPGVGGHLDLEV